MALLQSMLCTRHFWRTSHGQLSQSAVDVEEIGIGAGLGSASASQEDVSGHLLY